MSCDKEKVQGSIVLFSLLVLASFFTHKELKELLCAVHQFILEIRTEKLKLHLIDLK